MRSIAVLILLLILAVAAQAQVTLSANSASFSARAQISTAPAQKIILTGSGNISYTQFSGGCTGSTAQCNAVMVDFCAGTTVNSSSAAGQPVIHVASTNGFAARQTLVVGYKTSNAEYGTIASIGTGTIVLTANLGFTHISDAVDSDPCINVTTAPAAAWFWLYPPFMPTLSLGTASSIQHLASSSGFSASGDVTVALTVFANNQSTTTFVQGTATNCANTSSIFWDPKDTCTITPIANPSAASTFAIPAAGGSYVDGNFGTTVRVAGDPPTLVSPQDAQVTGFNADGTLAFMGTFNENRLHSTAGATFGSVIYANAPGPGNPTFDTHNPLLYYYTNGVAIHKVTLDGIGGACSSHCVDTVLASYTGPTGAAAQTRDTQINADDYWVAWIFVPLTITSITPGNPTMATVSGSIPSSLIPGSTVWLNQGGGCTALAGSATVTAVSAPTVTLTIDTSSGCGAYGGNATFKADVRACAINLVSLAQICSAAQQAAPNDIDAINITNLNTPDNKYYILTSFLGGGPAGRIYTFSPGDSTIVLKGNFPMFGYIANGFGGGVPNTAHFTGPHCSEIADSPHSTLCYPGPDTHMSLVSVAGVQFVAVMQSIQPPLLDIEFLRLDAGDNMVIDVESGGGLYHSFPVVTTVSSDSHVGGAMRAPVVVISFNDATGQQLSSVQISNVTISSGVPTITSLQTPTFANGDAVQISAVGGINGLVNNGANGIFCTVSGLSGNSWSCSNVSSASGTYNPNIGGTNWTAGVATKAVIPSPSSHSGEIDAIILSDLLTSNKTTVVRIAAGRSFGSSHNYNEVGTYYAQPHAIINETGTMVCWSSNLGLPDVDRSLCAATGFALSASASATVTSGVTSSGVVAH